MDAYRQKVLEHFYKQVKNTNWGDQEDVIYLRQRGRKPKQIVVAESVLRPKTQHKFFNFQK
jgi:hypothetical protein